MQDNMKSDGLVDISEITVDRDLSDRERRLEYLRQIKDPCHYKCKGITIHAKYADNGKSIEDCLRSNVS